VSQTKLCPGCQAIQISASSEGCVQCAPRPATFERWAVVEIMGHRRRAGRVSEVQEFGSPRMRVEIPRADGGFDVESYSGSAIFAYRFCSEEEARAAAALVRAPTMPQLPAASFADDDAEEALGDQQW
jgi:hypothetical protein